MRGPHTECDAFRARTHRWVQTLYFAFVVLVVGIAGIEITSQALSEDRGSSEQITCEAGLRRLSISLARARTASCDTQADEEQALRDFRASLRPEWDQLAAIRRACVGQQKYVDALDAIHRLRYAEDNAVRRESLELAKLRRHAQQLLGQDITDHAPFR